MNDNTTCKIIQDLLPSYIDGLTNEETTKFIEQHLSECHKCKKFLEEMKITLELENEKANKRDLKYMKKFNKKLTFLLIIIYIIGFIIIASSVRKIYIISKLSNISEKYAHSKNYHYLEVGYSYDTEEYHKSDIYRKDDNIKEISMHLIGDKLNKSTIFFNKGDMNFNSNNIYIENIDNKIAILNEEAFFGDGVGIPNICVTGFDYGMEIQNIFSIDNIFGKFINTIPVSIKSLNFNGKDCYFITNFSKFGMFSEYENLYIEKETGLPIYICYKDGTYKEYKFKFEFDCVTDEDFIEPDISDYKISDNVELDSLYFYKKFSKFSNEQKGSSIKELLNLFVQNIDENKNNDTKLPDIIYIEENSSNTMKSKLKDNIIDLDDISLKEISDSEIICSSDGTFKFKFDKESSFKVVSDSKNTNKDLILDMISKINEDDNYFMCIALNVDNNSSNEIDTIIINKR